MKTTRYYIEVGSWCDWEEFDFNILEYIQS